MTYLTIEPLLSFDSRSKKFWYARNVVDGLSAVEPSAFLVVPINAPGAMVASAEKFWGARNVVDGLSAVEPSAFLVVSVDAAEAMGG
jgi:hypothetical protein